MSASIQFILNQQPAYCTGPGGLTVLSYLRDHKRLTGTKEGCREGDCGACTVLLGELQGEGVRYQPVPSCLLPMAELHAKHLVTIEGLNQETLTPIQQALVDGGAVQCGFCTPGIVLSIVGWLLQPGRKREALDAEKILSGHLCRCTGYAAIKRALERLHDFILSIDQAEHPLTGLISGRVLPAYFSRIPTLLAHIKSIPRPSQEAIKVAGGTDLYVQKGDLIEQAEIEALTHRSDMVGIDQWNGFLRVGSLTRFEEFICHPAVQALIPDIANYGERMASWQVRHRATLGGNVVNASPIGDMTILLLALRALIVLSNGRTTRSLPLEKFFIGYKKLAKERDETVTHFHIPLTSSDLRIHFDKVSKRRYLDIASVNSALAIRADGGVLRQATLSFGGVAPIPMVATQTAGFLISRPINARTLSEAAEVLQREIQPISDVRGSAGYKRLLARQLLLAHFVHLYPDLIPVQEVLWI